MGSIGILLAWMVLGLCATCVWSLPGEPRLSWAPMAVILGPLWLVISNERRHQALEQAAER